MKFTAKLADQIAQKFNEAAPSASCPLCGNSEFTLVNGFVSINVSDAYPPKNALIADKNAPTVMMICTTCGNTFLLNTLILGIIEPDV